MLGNTMKVLSLATIVLFLICGSTVRAAPHRHHMHYHMRVPLPQPRPNFGSTNFFSNWFQPMPQATIVPPIRHRHVKYVHEEPVDLEEQDVSLSRPSDCYGIAWCGCFLRHYLGLADTALNSAIEWAHVGQQTTPHAGAIVVWRHHVGLLKGDPVNGRALVLSGNDGHRVRIRSISLHRVVAYRQL